LKKTIYIISIFILVFFSCKTTNKSVKTAHINSRKLEKIIKKSDFKFNYFSCKTRVIYNKQKFTANLRIKQDSIIWISLTGPFGIEGARLIILKDHYEFKNKLNRKYYNKPLTDLEKYLPLKIDYNMLENLLVGNFIENKLKKQKIETKNNNYIVKGAIDTYNVLYSILPYGKIDSIEIQSLDKKQNIKVHYYKYEKVENQDFSLRRKFEIKNLNEKNLLDLKFYKINLNKVDFPFKKPNN